MLCRSKSCGCEADEDDTAASDEDRVLDDAVDNPARIVSSTRTPDTVVNPTKIVSSTRTQGFSEEIVKVVSIAERPIAEKSQPEPPPLHYSERQLVATSATNNSGKTYATSLTQLTQIGCYEPDLEDEDLVTFARYSELLRASPLAELMRNQAAIFGSCKGCENTFKLSLKVNKIDSFISHNWSVSRRRKNVALVFAFNVNIAMIFTLVVLILLVILQTEFATGWLDYMQKDHSEMHHSDKTMITMPRGFLCRALGQPALFLSIFFCRDLQALLRYPSRKAFLDKTCIHQTDKVKQKAGIRKLAAFIAKSTEMVVLYTPIYFKKLWTVYEIASFLTVKPGARLQLVPTMMSETFFLVHAIFWVENMVVMFTEILSLFVEVYWFRFGFAIGYYITGFVIMFLLRSFAKQRADILNKLDNFEVRECLCTCEEDRPVIYENIAILMQWQRNQRRITDDGNDMHTQNALSAFNELVRANVPRLLKKSVPRFLFNYRIYFSFSLLSYGVRSLDGLAGSHHGWISVATIIAMVVAVIPMGFAKMAWLCKRSPVAKSFCVEAIFIFFLYTLLVWCPVVCITLALRNLELRAQDSGSALCGLVVSIIFLLFMVLLVFGRRSIKNVCKKNPRMIKSEIVRAVGATRLSAGFSPASSVTKLPSSILRYQANRNRMVQITPSFATLPDSRVLRDETILGSSIANSASTGLEPFPVLEYSPKPSNLISL